MRKWALVFTILSVLLPGFAAGLAGCSPERLNDGLDDDSDTDGGTMLPPGTQTCNMDAECGSGRRCVNNVCVPDNGTCMGGSSDTDTCQADTYCACPPEVKASSCVCVPWGTKPRGDHDDMCTGQAFSPGDFKNPILKCQWPAAGNPGYANVISTPLVIDLDRDGAPEIVFQAGYPGSVHLIAMSGRDCTVKFDKTTSISGCTHIAVGDA